MSKVTVIEYSEQKKEAQSLNLDNGPVIDHESFDDGSLVISFDELDDEEPEEVVIISPESDILEFDEGELLDNLSEEISDTDETIDNGFRLPGAYSYVDDDEDEEDDKEKEEEIEEIRDWIKDRDPKYFMEYILGAYPDGIPPHDGKSTLGCERAILYLTKLNKEISEALRADKEDLLDLGSLENIRVNMIRDVVTLKEHIKKLNKKLKKAEDSQNNLQKEAELKKEATTPGFKMVITPFERAITGIIINSVVSAGKPLEDVYEFLKNKYNFTDREELSIQQLLMDMGQPIFKDRGTIGDKDNDMDGQGVDFIKNYFG